MKVLKIEVQMMLILVTVVALTHALGVNGDSLHELTCEETSCSEDLCVNGTCLSDCKDGYYGPSCIYNCSRGCAQLSCQSTETGTENCTNGCIPGYWGVTCKAECFSSCRTCSRDTGKTCTSCPDFHHGSACEKKCAAACPNTDCYMNGTCKRELIACPDGTYGPKCQWRCSTTCLFDTCNRTSGVCLHGCKQGFFGKRCESGCTSTCKGTICDRYEGKCTEGCKTGYYGVDCDLECGRSCRLLLCQRDTGDCSNGCGDGFFGNKCNSTCFPGCFVCNGITGVCEVFETSTHNDTNANVSDETSETNLTGYILGIFGGVLLCIVVGSLLFIRSWRISYSKQRMSQRNVQNTDGLRRLPDLPVAVYQYEYNTITEEDMDPSNQRVNFVSLGVIESLSFGAVMQASLQHIFQDDVPRDPESESPVSRQAVEGCQTSSLLIPESENVSVTPKSKYFPPVESERDIHSV